jgi:hypothetical protein
MAEVLPNSATAYDQRIDKVEMPDESTTTTITETGTVAAIDERIAYYRAQAILNGDISSISTSSSNGRASITVYYERESWDMRRLGIQELIAFDVVRDIRCAPYFEELTNEQIADVMAQWDNRGGVDIIGWDDLQISLYGHLAHGQESYIETAYEFRQTFQTTSLRKLNIAAKDPNTVQDLPMLSFTIGRLIKKLPDGEWLKKPVSVQYAGKKGWTVTLVWQWAPKWSVIYGGSFTGLDPE